MTTSMTAGTLVALGNVACVGFQYAVIGRRGSFLALPWLATTEIKSHLSPEDEK